MRQNKTVPLEEASPPKRPYGGRPSLKEAEQLYDRILDAAAELFARRGYGETSIEAIATHAGIGKLTLYRRFSDKEALFQAVAVRMSEQRRAEMAKIDEGEGSPSEVLIAVGRRLLDIVLSPESIAFHRIVFADAARFPDLCAHTYQEAPPESFTPIRAIFRRFVGDGTLRVDDVTLLDQQFIQAIIGQPLLRTLLGGPAMGEREREEHVHKAVDLFLNGAAA